MMEPLSCSPDASMAAEGRQAPLPSCHQPLGSLCPVPGAQYQHLDPPELSQPEGNPGHSVSQHGLGAAGAPSITRSHFSPAPAGAGAAEGSAGTGQDGQGKRLRQ